MAPKELILKDFFFQGKWENRGGVFLSSSVSLKIGDKWGFVKDNDKKNYLIIINS
jgi:hypothetical protein